MNQEKELEIRKSKIRKEGKLRCITALVTPVGNWVSVPLGTC